MTETLTPTRSTDPGGPPRLRRGPLISLAAAAVVILIIGITTFVTLTGDGESPVVTDPPEPTLPDSSRRSPLPADTPPLNVVAAINAEWDDGDLIAAGVLIHPESPYSVQAAPALAAELWYRLATGAVVQRECAEGTPAELLSGGAQLQGGTVVTCTETIISGVEPGAVIGGGRVAIEVGAGWVLNVFVLPDVGATEYVGALSERGDPNQFIGQYRNWVQQRFPDDVDALFTAATMIVATPEAQAKHLDFVPFFVADTGPRGSRALDPDTPLLDVVATFTARYDAGDIEGYEAIFHPLSGYPSGQDAMNSWFTSVTGMTADRDCALVEPTQVRCDEVIYSGLLPGTVVAEVTTLWNGAAGWIWSIEFDGAVDANVTDPNLGPGVKEYRAWVQANAPEAFDELFAAGVRMRLETEEGRAAHREMIAAYLAATEGG